MSTLGFGTLSRRVDRIYLDGALGTAVSDFSQSFAFTEISAGAIFTGTSASSVLVAPMGVASGTAQGSAFGVASHRVDRINLDGALGTAATAAGQWFAFAGALTISDTGSATATVNFAASATGTSSRSVSITRSVSFTLTVVGAKREAQSASVKLSLVITATGAKKLAESVSISSKYSLSAIGAKRVTESVSLSADLSISVSGAKRITETVIASDKFALSATGTKKLTQSASASGAFSLASAGYKKISESASVSGMVALSATGQKRVVVDVTAAVPTLSLACTGSAGTGDSFSGAPTATIALTGVSTGAKKLSEAVTISVGITASCTGKKVITKSVALSTSLALSCAGAKRITKSVSASASLSLTGTAQHIGVLRSSFAISAVGHGSRMGVPVATVELEASCTGSKGVASELDVALAFEIMVMGSKRANASASTDAYLKLSCTGETAGVTLTLTGAFGTTAANAYFRFVPSENSFGFNPFTLQCDAFGNLNSGALTIFGYWTVEIYGVQGVVPAEYTAYLAFTNGAVQDLSELLGIGS